MKIAGGSSNGAVLVLVLLSVEVSHLNGSGVTYSLSSLSSSNGCNFTYQYPSDLLNILLSFFLCLSYRLSPTCGSVTSLLRFPEAFCASSVGSSVVPSVKGVPRCSTRPPSEGRCSGVCGREIPFPSWKDAPCR